MNKIIVISGKQYSGKDTLAKILLEKLSDFRRIGIGDAIKFQYAKENNITFNEIIKNKHLYREGLIKLGNWGRSQHPHYWLKYLSDMDKIIVPDLRVQDEADFFREKGAFLIRVNSTYENRSKRGIIVSNDDNTETALDNYKNWNVVIDNDSDFEELNKKADMVIDSFINFINY